MDKGCVWGGLDQRGCGFGAEPCALMFGESESSLNSGLVIQTADLQSLSQLRFTHHLFAHPPPTVPAHLVASAQRLLSFLWAFQHSPSRGPRTLILACRPIERRRSRVRCLHALESVEPDAVFRDTSTRGTLKSLNNRRVRCRLLQSSSCASKVRARQDCQELTTRSTSLYTSSRAPGVAPCTQCWCAYYACVAPFQSAVCSAVSHVMT